MRMSTSSSDQDSSRAAPFDAEPTSCVTFRVRAIRFAHRPKRTERGAELVEFALIGVLLFTILLGTIDFGWSFSQYLDIKSGAREGARLAIVNGDTGGTQTAKQNCQEIVNTIESRMSDTTSSKVNVYMSFTGSGDPATGDTATVTVTYPRSSLTGFTTALGGGTLHSTVTMRLEQTPNWSLTTPATYSVGGAAPKCS